MRPKDYPDLVAFALVARRGSFARAAAEMGVSRSALSHAMRGLEERLGVRLLNRTTRAVSPTPAGEALLTRLGPAIADVEAAVEGVQAWRDRPAGLVRLNASRLAAMTALAPRLAFFLAEHPDVRLEVSVNDALVDVVADGFDAGIRFEETLEQDMIALPVGPPVEFAVVGAPVYLTGRPAPEHPRDLARHACVRHRMIASGRLYDWEFERDGEALEVAVDGPLTTDDPELMLRAALDGAGLAYVGLEDARPHLETGRLLRVLADWCPEVGRLHLYHPSRRQTPAALRALIEAVR